MTRQRRAGEKKDLLAKSGFISAESADSLGGGGGGGGGGERARKDGEKKRRRGKDEGSVEKGGFELGDNEIIISGEPICKLVGTT